MVSPPLRHSARALSHEESPEPQKTGNHQAKPSGCKMPHPFGRRIEVMIHSQVERAHDNLQGGIHWKNDVANPVHQREPCHPILVWIIPSPLRRKCFQRPGKAGYHQTSERSIQSVRIIEALRELENAGGDEQTRERGKNYVTCPVRQRQDACFYSAFASPAKLPSAARGSKS